MYEDDESSLHSAYSEASYDSDKIDSDIEAELYSAIHHESITTPTSELSLNNNSLVENGNESSNLCASFGTPEVKVVKNYSKDKLAALGEDFSTTCKSGEDLGDRNSEVKSDENDCVVGVNNKTLEVMSVKDGNNKKLKRKYEALISNALNPNPIKFNGMILDDNVDITSQGPSKKQKTKIPKNQDRKSINKPVVEVNSSDSDSIIWSDGDDVQQIEIQTNLNNEPEVVSLSSDSFSDDSFDPFDVICSSGQESSSQLGAPSSSGDPWQINSEDLYRANRRGGSSRYHERAVLNCTNCKLKGHTFKFCSAPKTLKCFICGEDHQGSVCKGRVCRKCFKVGHDTRFCGQRFMDFCDLCNMRGHPVKYCPDLWRRYHVTTTSGKIVVANSLPQKSPIYCFNCGEQGHNGATCRVAPPDKNCFPTWTSVIAHEHPHDTIKRSMAERRQVALGGTPNWTPIKAYQQQNFQQCQQQSSAQKKKKKKKNSLEGNLQTPKGVKKKKNKKTNNSNTPKANSGASSSKDFRFPRTPRSETRKKVKRKTKEEPFLNGKHKRHSTISPLIRFTNQFV